MGFERRFKELLNPRAYKNHPAVITLIQTHISYLFLTPGFVYKVKKAVNFGFLDFTTLEKRRHYCAEEVRLNIRLAPDVYLGVVEIKECNGALTVEGEEGETIEYAVKMRRLSEETILEEKIRRGVASEKDIQRVAEAIARFHGKAGRGDHISACGTPEIIKKNIIENFTQTEDLIGSIISRSSSRGIKDYALKFIEENRPLLLKRIEGGFIRECHGDIHSEHISLNRRIEIIDCIEFNERFRFSDTISEMAFLSMDLDFHNRSDLARAFEEHYLEAAADHGGRELINFYKSYRAYIRGKVEGLKTAETEVGKDEQQKARIKAARYFDLAEAYTKGAPRPRLIIICGISGTGKSTLAEALGEALWAEPLATDRIRREVLSSDKAPTAARYGEGRYSLEKKAEIYERLIERACSDYLNKGRTVILDGTFSKNSFLDKAMKAARGAGLATEDITVFECTLGLSALRERVRIREAGNTAAEDKDRPLSEMRSDILEAHIAEYEKKEKNITRLDTTSPIETNLLTMIKVILGKGQNIPGGIRQESH